jgi:hypothetical protein
MSAACGPPKRSSSDVNANERKDSAVGANTQRHGEHCGNEETRVVEERTVARFDRVHHREPGTVHLLNQTSIDAIEQHTALEWQQVRQERESLFEVGHIFKGEAR